MHISIPRRNRRPKEKEQLQVRQDLCKCRGRARVSSGRVGAVVVRILVLAKWAGLTSERQLVGGSGGNCYYFRRVPALCNRLEAAESCSEMGRSCLAPHEGPCRHTGACLAYGLGTILHVLPPSPPSFAHLHIQLRQLGVQPWLSLLSST